MSGLTYEQQQKRWEAEDELALAEGRRSRAQTRRRDALQMAKDSTDITVGPDFDTTTANIVKRADAFVDFLNKAEEVE